MVRRALDQPQGHKAPAAVPLRLHAAHLGHWLILLASGARAAPANREFLPLVSHYRPTVHSLFARSRQFHHRHANRSWSISQVRHCA